MSQRRLSLDGCLMTVVEHYLLADLTSMAEDIEWKESGNVCYRVLIAVLAGSELLGRLAGGTRKAEVDHYWKSFMARIKPDYAKLAPLAQHILRNGVMHTYFTKPGVGVVRKIPGAHLTVDDGLLLLDCGVLADHFRESYFQHAKSYLSENREAAEKRVDALHEEATQLRSSRIPGSARPDAVSAHPRRSRCRPDLGDLHTVRREPVSGRKQSDAVVATWVAPGLGKSTAMADGFLRSPTLHSCSGSISPGHRCGKVRPQLVLKNWIDRGELPAVRVGRRVRIRRTDLDALIDAGQTLPHTEPDATAAFWSGDAIPDRLVEP